jgi:hypothetical protein
MRTIYRISTPLTSLNMAMNLIVISITLSLSPSPNKMRPLILNQKTNFLKANLKTSNKGISMLLFAIDLYSLSLHLSLCQEIALESYHINLSLQFSMNSRPIDFFRLFFYEAIFLALYKTTNTNTETFWR